MSNNTISESAPDIIVILGATGDLAPKKLFPALWHLFRLKRIPDRFSVIGVARRKFSDLEFRALVRESIEKRGGIEDENMFANFLALFSYHTASFDDADAFKSLSDLIEEKERAWGVCGNKLFYMAVPPIAYEPILQNLAKAKLNLPCGGKLGWSRVLVEKPFGFDGKSANNLQALLTSYFQESQIYRIDHYLFKEVVQGIEHFRFSNNLFERNWNKETIERIDIRILETIGVEDRGAFYDGVGALIDVGQNHMLAMLSAITMDMKSLQNSDEMHASRAEILSHLAEWSDESIKNNVYRAQVEGYKEIVGVAPNSETETYFALKTEISHPKWRGVPITLEAGKNLGEARKEIVVTLKSPLICLKCDGGTHGSNTITFQFEPNDKILINFWTKKPGFERILEGRSLSFFVYEKESKVQYVEEYAKVINSALIGDQSSFVSSQEISAMWKFTDPIETAWEQNMTPLHLYKKGESPKSKLLLNDIDMEASSRGSIGMIGLGKMGANLARQLNEKKWNVVGYNDSKEATIALSQEGIEATYSLAEMVTKIPTPRTLWIMVPHAVVDKVIAELSPLLSEGDTIVDGGNSPYKDSIRRASELKDKKIHFLDVGVSGGPSGARTGACLMIGGEKNVYKSHEQLFRDLSVENGYKHVGKSGAGHFVKMVHNGIEYGMMESIAEGFGILKRSDFSLSLIDVADIYQHQSVITSRLVEWLKRGFEEYGEDLDTIEGRAGSTGEGAWTVETAKELGVESGSIEHALNARANSQINPSYAGKLIQVMRAMFGGHGTKNDLEGKKHSV